MPHHLYLDWPGPGIADPHNRHDPEGFLSDLPAVGTALLGVLTGLWLRGQRTVTSKALGLAVGAVACLATGYFWSIWFPLNKKLWTSSYVLVAAGYSLVVLALAFWAVEKMGWRKGWTWPWIVFGSNAIVAYMFSELILGAVGLIPIGPGAKHSDGLNHLFRGLFTCIPNPGWQAFAYSASFTAICIVPVWILYRKRIFVKV
jgi:predicted acyltransferase